MDNFKRFLKYVFPYKSYLVLSMFFNILYSLFSAMSMVSLMPMLNVLFGESERICDKPIYKDLDNIGGYLKDSLNYFVTTNTETNGPQSTLTWMVAIVLLTFLLKNLFSFLSIIYMTFLNNGVLKDIRNDVYNKITNLPVAFFSEKRKGDLIARMTTDIATIKSAFMGVLMMIGREPLTIVFTLVAMFIISWKLTIYVLIVIPISGWIISLIGRKIKNQAGNLFALEGRLISIIEETLGGIKIIKNFTSEDYFNKTFVDSTNILNKLTNKLSIRTSSAGPMSEFMGILVISSLLWYAGNLVLVEHSLKTSAFLAYMGLAYQILTPAKAMAKANYALNAGNAASNRVQYILDAVNPLKDKIDAKVLDGFNKEIKFNNISFMYDKNTVIENFSLTIPKGKTVALVGESGSGKSTLANLITRFYDVTKGNITFDGIDIKDVTTKSLRQQMGIVAQDSILFNDSIKNNISLGINNPSENEIIHAAKIANAHNFISEFPKKYNNPVGDGGGMLSGGQRQRIAIARAVMKNPPIMILDEATSALDTESEKVVQDALENMMKNRTSLVIAHRLSTVQNADLIVVMKKGKIVEQGTHQELINLGGTYTNLVNLQSLENKK
ncbi:MAG: ABC transporter ATP-binding protein [Flavobacteriaceae bacterium]|nr:ABC transporter ATP-binding protein [Flavobacteriaceae bacterium]